MSASSKSAFLVSVALGLAWVQAGGCSSSDMSPNRAGGSYDAGLPPIQLDAPMADQSAGGIPGLDPLCGMAVCLPDSPAKVPGDAGATPPQGGGNSGEGGAPNGQGGAEAGGAAGDDGSGGAPGAGGAGGEGGSAEGGGGGAPGDDAGTPGSGGADAGSTGGVPGAAGSNDTPTPVEGCRIMRRGDRIVSEYGPAGAQDVNGPCFSSADCKPGLGCVNEENIGRCLPFCCKGNDSCLQPGTYCAPRPLLEMPINSGANQPGDGLLVPVCVAAVACSLEQPYPCPAGMDCTCGDKACLVVRSNGLTSCEEPLAEPGQGLVGQACPCAWGHVCSQATGTCAELCSTASDAKACSQGKCQDTAELPAGWGVCVAVAASR
jgi:hypothetical protein